MSRLASSFLKRESTSEFTTMTMSPMVSLYFWMQA